MAAQKGSLLLLKIGATPTGSAASDTYTTIGGLRSTSISMNQETVDVTNKDSANVREMLADGGVESVSISGSGVFTDAASEATLRTAFGGSSIPNFQIIIPDFGTYTGKFIVTTLEYAGEYNGEVTYSVSLESSGATTFATV
jgi:TP901-1 family phage major tail protein